MVIHNAWTLDVDFVNKKGLDDEPGGRWLVHDSPFQTSNVCFIYQKDYLKELQKKLTEWGMHKNHQITGAFN